MNPRDARRERRNQGGRGYGDQHGEGLWDDIVGNKGQKFSLAYDADAIESGVKDIAHSAATSGVGKAVGRAYNSYEGYMDKHPFIHDLTDDAAIGLGVAGLTLATGGLGDAAVVGAEGAEADAAETAAEDGASKAARTAEDDDEDLGPEPEPEPLRQSFANPASVGDAGASAEANAGEDGVMSGEAESANKKASDALKDAGKKISDKAKQEVETQVSTMRDKLKAVGKTAGLAVVGERGEELTKDADKDEHADDDDDGPGGGKGGTTPKPPPGYFANQFNEQLFSANSKALQHDGPSRTFGDPWYS
jgi:hypothetical protein